MRISPLANIIGMSSMHSRYNNVYIYIICILALRFARSSDLIMTALYLYTKDLYIYVYIE